ncbi:GNAT family N-acetyltransferase [Streptomyces sp. ISL-99]|uniref:GNAT family N-acetyltransferase n=1 Tax=Streptomyces sp. ISL-99 TaxID=2819193 RepID=UPI001BE62EFC|nr:GNAT family N-acetyltransferase [Streptomyces sp. ISL-99]MBT2525919.1 GNAT family N-acetyltransferase [Streptomyces sp. ISL-99]
MPAYSDSVSIGAAGPVPVECVLQRRPLTRAEADEVVAQIRRSPKITGYSRSEWRGRRDTFALVRRDGGELVGALLVHHLVGGWAEIAVVFVLEEHRGRGYGRQLLAGALDMMADTGKRLLLFYSEGSPMGALARDHGFDIHADEDAFVRGMPGRRIFLKYIYTFQWLCSFYRIREMRRKRRELDCTFDFKVAFLHTEGIKK